MNLYFPYAGWCLLLFFAGGSGVLNSNWHVWQWKEEAMLYEIHMRDFKSHFQQDFLAYCTRPVSIWWWHVSASCSFNGFSVFLLSLKQQQNLMKIMFSCIHFPVWPYPPKIMKKMYFILVNCMGWQVWDPLLTFLLSAVLFAPSFILSKQYPISKQYGNIHF